MDQPIGTPDWLSSARRQLEEELNVAQRSQEEQEQQLECCGETLQLLVDTIKTILSNHNRQLGDVKHLLRAMAKVSSTHTHCKHRGRCGSGPRGHACRFLFSDRTRRPHWPTART